MNKHNKLIALVIVAVLAGCGGDDDNDSSSHPPASGGDFQGLYMGTTSMNQKMSALVLDDNSLYALYSARGDSNTIYGMIQGSVTASNGSLSSSDAIDYSIAGAGNNAATVSASYIPKMFLNGTLSYPGAGGNVVTFTAQYDASYEKMPPLAALAGSYYSSVAAGSSQGRAGVAILNTGYVGLVGPGACKAVGTIAPRASGNAYALTLRFDGTVPCSYANQTFTGITATIENDGVVGIAMFARAEDTSSPLLVIGGKVSRSEK